MGRTFRLRKRKKTLKPKFIVSCCDPDVRLLQWMKTKTRARPTSSCLLCCKHLKAAVFSDTGRGLLTLKNISIGDVILSIPPSLFITKCTVVERSLGGYLRKSSGSFKEFQLNEIDTLTLFLMFEKLQAEESPWYNYLQTLPASYTTLPYFPKSCITKFPEDFKEEINVQNCNLKNKFKDLQPALSHVFKEKIELISFQHFKWAWFTVNTRCVYINYRVKCLLSSDTVALMPFLDLLNHSHQAKVKAEFNTLKGTFEIISKENVKKYSQVFICYGAHSNRKLLKEYGFVSRNNPNDIIPIDKDEILEAVLQLKEFQTDCLYAKHNLETIKKKGIVSQGTGCTAEGLTWNTVVLICALISKVCFQSYKDILKNVTEESNTATFCSIANYLLHKKLQEYEELLNLSKQEHYDVTDRDFVSLVDKFLIEEKSVILMAMSLYQ